MANEGSLEAPAKTSKLSQIRILGGQKLTDIADLALIVTYHLTTGITGQSFELPPDLTGCK